ncbi:TetR/AcrR family transcriptional regulator [Moraxella sp. TY6]
MAIKNTGKSKDMSKESNVESSSENNSENRNAISKESTRDKLLKLASELMREKGYAGFSYADLADEIGIKKASIHHYFPTKADLGLAVVSASHDDVRQTFAKIESNHSDVQGRLTAYVDLFTDTCERLPMCAALVADKHKLPEVLIAKTQDNFTLQLDWLEKVLNQAVENKEIQPLNISDTALMILNLCEGASLVANALGDKGIFERTKKQILAMVG